MSYMAANYLLFIPTLVYCFRGTPVTLGVFARGVAIPLGCTAAAAVVAISLGRLSNTESRHLVFLLTYVSIVLGVYAIRKPVRETIGSIVMRLPLSKKRWRAERRSQ